MKTFIIKGRTLSCEIVRMQRRTVAIQIHPDKRIELKVPLLYNIDEVEPFLVKHHRWIFNRLDAPEKKSREPKKFVDGEMHYFLGKQYPLRIIISPENTVEFRDDTIIVYAKYNVSDLIAVLLERWYYQQAHQVFQEISIPLMKQMEKYNVFPKSFTIKKMKTRWGSCSSKGSINLNLDLIKLPEDCIKAVILHELCHLVHMNHSTEFYALMTAEMPDWKVWDKQLKFL